MHRKLILEFTSDWRKEQQEELMKWLDTEQLDGHMFVSLFPHSPVRGGFAIKAGEPTSILRYRDFKGSIEYSPEEDNPVLFGRILGITDLVSYEGFSIEELQKGFREAVEDYIETCNQLGKNPI